MAADYAIARPRAARPRFSLDEADFLGALLVAPAILFIVLLVALPFFLALYYSVSAYNMATLSFSFVGLQNFIAVTKSDGEWQQLKPAILGAIMEHYMSGAPLLADGSAANDEEADEADEFFNEEDADTVAQIKDLIETRVRPAVANDGGDITFRGFKDGIVYLDMKGACSGCPSSTATLRHGIQNLLRYYIPDVVEVRPTSG